MAATTKRIYTVSEASAILQTKLGSIRAWPAFLNDCARGKASWQGVLKGLEIHPCGHGRDRSRRPLYSGHDLAVFIHAVQLAVPESRDPHELGRLVTANFDDGKAWQTRRLA